MLFQGFSSVIPNGNYDLFVLLLIVKILYSASGGKDCFNTKFTFFSFDYLHALFRIERLNV